MARHRQKTRETTRLVESGYPDSAKAEGSSIVDEPGEV